MAATNNSPVIYAAITSENRDLLDRIAVDVFDDDIDADKLDFFLSLPSHRLLVAVADHQVVGQCLGIMTYAVDRRPSLLIENLGVSPDYRRRGIARDMIDQMCAWATDLGAEYMWLGSDPESHTAEAFYRGIGLPMQITPFTEVKLPLTLT